MATIQTDPCAVAHTRPMRHVRGQTAELRCGVCRMRDLLAGGSGRAPCVAVAHFDGDGALCVHERPQGGHKRHVGDEGYPFHRDDSAPLMASFVRPRCKHRLRGTAADVAAEVERGRTTVYLDAA